MITVRNISKTYTSSKGRHVRALDGVSFSVDKGEIFGIIGQSGAGKSTILRCLNMLERPDSGEITVDGKVLTSMGELALQPVRRQIGMIFQHFNLLASRTIFQNVALPLELQQTPSSVIRQRVRELLDLVGLSGKAQDYPGSLSGGQKQRVAIARALATNPSLLLCDEATSALDPATTRSILDLLLRINDKFQITIVLITHEIQVIKSVCDRVAVVQEGKIIELGDREQIFGNPQHPQTTGFVSSAVQARLPMEYLGGMTPKRSQSTDDLLIRIQTKNDSDYSFSRFSSGYGLAVRVIEGHVETIGSLTLGSFVLRLSGESAEEATADLSAYYINPEILGYVSRSY